MSRSPETSAMPPPENSVPPDGPCPGLSWPARFKSRLAPRLEGDEMRELALQCASLKFPRGKHRVPAAAHTANAPTVIATGDAGLAFQESLIASNACFWSRDWLC